ncbi:DNA-directed DNA polymerase epsilon, subunit B [Blastocladiella emersonii ATCC 22665]|nr:DNA-directed DNA polymerase epsilon, subunit B [Blastocladiella emersonii ATCC 22665]
MPAPTSAELRRAIHRVLSRQYGLTVQLDAVQYLEKVIVDYGIDAAEVPQTLDLIAQTYRNDLRKAATTGSDAAVVTRNDLTLVITRLENNASGSTAAYQTQTSGSQDPMDLDGSAAPPADELGDDVALPTLVHVVNAFEQPRWRYSPEQKTFYRVRALPSAMADAPSKVAVHRDRFELLKQRIMRNPHFRPSSFSGAQSERLFTLTPIASLRGNEGREYVLFGMLTRLEEGKVFLEDSSGFVELDLSGAAKSRGFFTETCFVVVEGRYTSDKIFQAFAISMPPAETRDATVEAFGQLDFLGAPADVYDDVRLLQIEQKYDGVCMVFLSDVFLDVPSVMTALRRFLTGCNDALLPLVIVMCGNFTSVPVPPAQYRDLWATFAGLLAGFRNLAEHTTWVFVPGPQDPWGPHVIPRAPIPQFFTQKVYTTLKRVVFASAPCRIKYCTQEIVVHRADTLAKLYRNCVVPPSFKGAPEADPDADEEEEEVQDGLGGTEATVAKDLPYHLARTLVDQAHLCPLPVHVHPVMWEYDGALRLYPLPHLVVQADAADRYHERYEGVDVCNPGSFSATGEWGFTIYYPHSREVQANFVPRD